MFLSSKMKVKTNGKDLKVELKRVSPKIMNVMGYGIAMTILSGSDSKEGQALIEGLLDGILDALEKKGVDLLNDQEEEEEEEYFQESFPY